jgi:hypothetical protein
MAALETACHHGVDLVCVMAANNEVGTLYPVEVVARVAAQAAASTLIGNAGFTTSLWALSRTSNVDPRRTPRGAAYPHPAKY